MKIFVILLNLIFISFAAPCSGLENASAIIFQAMQEEMKRSLSSLKIEKYPLPYFINYQIRHRHRVEVMASLGALLNSTGMEKRSLFVDVRVGDPEFDSSMLGSHKHNVEQFIPLDNELLSLKRAIWYETDLRYKQAVMNLLKKKGRFFSGVDKHEWPDFTKGNSAVVEIKEIPPYSIDIQKWKNLVRKISAHFLKAPEIEKSRVKIIFDRTIRYYLDSEGNKIQDANQFYGVILDAWEKNSEGVQIHDQESIFFKNLEQFPSEQEIIQKTNRLMKNMLDLKNADKAEPYVGPAIFSPEASAILFHEALGHRLEGDRLRKTHDGKTFLKKIGQPILPYFLTVTDDPTLQKFNGQDLMGQYVFDDQGQRGEKVLLVDKGILRNFLLSRAPILTFNKTNGHARNDGVRTPMSRMSTFIISSDHKLSLDHLKRRLIEEIKKQKKPYGLMIKKMISGETFTDNRDFQVFKGRPLYVIRVYPEDGREELVRGVEFVGTPLSIVNKVIATGDEMEVINGFCTAESGTIPVTTIAPSILLSEVELQTSHDISLRLPILPPPESEKLPEM